MVFFLNSPPPPPFFPRPFTYLPSLLLRESLKAVNICPNELQQWNLRPIYNEIRPENLHE
jgi:hypothetical protein